MRVSKREIEEEGALFRARHQIETEESLREWLVRNAVTEEELQGHLEESALESKLRNLFSVSNNRETIWELREAGRFESLLAGWRDRNTARLEGESGVVTSQQELFSLYKMLIGDHRDKTLAEAVMRLGFHSKTNMLAELLKIHQYRSSRADKSGA